jgi:hypothetical protein
MAFKMKRPTMFSTEGFKRDSPDVKNKQNLIPSGDITMEGVDFPVHGVDNLGNEKIMKPGEKNISFPGNAVLETPIKIRNMAFKMKNPTTEILTGLSGNSMMEAAKDTPLEKKGKKYQRTRKGAIASAARAASNA